MENLETPKEYRRPSASELSNQYIGPEKSSTFVGENGEILEKFSRRDMEAFSDEFESVRSLIRFAIENQDTEIASPEKIEGMFDSISEIHRKIESEIEWMENQKTDFQKIAARAGELVTVVQTLGFIQNELLALLRQLVVIEKYQNQIGEAESIGFQLLREQISPVSKADFNRSENRLISLSEEFFDNIE